MGIWGQKGCGGMRDFSLCTPLCLLNPEPSQYINFQNKTWNTKNLKELWLHWNSQQTKLLPEAGVLTGGAERRILRERPCERPEGTQHPGRQGSGQNHPRSPLLQRGRTESTPKRLPV